MTVFTRQACGFNNATAVLTYSYDDALTPPQIVEIRLINNGAVDTFNVSLFTHDAARTLIHTFSRSTGQGDLVLNRAGIVGVFGDLRMLDVVGRNLSHGWDLPFFIECWS